MTHRILAKKVDKPDGQNAIPYSATLPGHTEQVLDVAITMNRVLADKYLRFIGDDSLVDDFKKSFVLAAILHDIGKSNKLFQDMVTGRARDGKQPVRHELVSDWILRKHAGVRRAVLSYLGLDDDADFSFDWRWVGLRAAILGHHLKFPPAETSMLAKPVPVPVDHPDFNALLRLLENVTGQNVPSDSVPLLMSDYRTVNQEVVFHFEEAVEDAGLSEDIDDPILKAVALLRIMLVAADSLGSFLTHSREEWKEHVLPVIEDGISGIDMVPYFNQLRQYRLQQRGENPEISMFQQRVADSSAMVTVVEAGCGAGKTLAACQWAARQYARNFFLAYPTTATATQGYMDYGLTVEEISRLLHSRSDVDLELLGTGEDDEGDTSIPSAVERIQRPLVLCTVDTILGVIQNTRSSSILFPKLLNSVVVFDEVHAYDDRLFEHLLEFLRHVRIPVLIMSASIQPERKERLKKVLAERQVSVQWITGPSTYEQLKRYRIHVVENLPRQRLWKALRQGEKVLLVFNTVERAQKMYVALKQESEEMGIPANWYLYHARYEYQDRVERQQEVVQAFRSSGACCAVTTQICEMSFDISADLLLSEIPDFAASIQRLGRLNRYAQQGTPVKEAYFWLPESFQPYEQWQVTEAEKLLKTLTEGEISQADLAAALQKMAGSDKHKKPSFTWLQLQKFKSDEPLRERGHTVDCIRQERLHVMPGNDATLWKRYVLSMPYINALNNCSRFRYLYVVSDDILEYSRETGGRWRNGKTE